MSAQLFTPRANLASRGCIAGCLSVVVGLGVIVWAYTRSSYATGEDVVVEQPVPFSHAHHVGGLGIDCRYCHTAVELSSSAGMPPTETCMNCHSQLWTESEVLEPVRESWRTGQPLRWQRVHWLPDHVFFDHSIHVAKGIGCSSCHGRVDRMPLIHQTESLLMQWCLDCHREPWDHVRPLGEVFDMDWTPPADQEQRGRALVERYGIDTSGHLTDCTICHR